MPIVRKLIVSSPTAPQSEFWASDARFKLIVGGVGSGKSFAGSVELLKQPAGSVGMVIAPTYPMLRDSTQMGLLELCRRAKVIVDFNQTKNVLKLKGDRTILMRTAEKPDRLRGPNLGWFWLDEAAMMPAKVWEIMLGRLRLDPGRAWASTTPRGKNWLYDTFVAGDGPEFAHVSAPTRTNPHNREGFAESLESQYDAEFARQELGGEFLDDPSGKLIWADFLDAACLLRLLAPERHNPIAEGPRRISCDPSEGRGADDAVIIVRDDLGLLHVEASNRMSPSDAADRIDQLKQEYRVGPAYISIDGGGGAGRETARYLQAKGIHPKQYFGSGKGGHRFFNLRAASGWRAREAIHSGGFGLARAGKHLPQLKKELGMLTYFMVKDQLALVKKDDLMIDLRRSPDVSDCLIQSFSYA